MKPYIPDTRKNRIIKQILFFIWDIETWIEEVGWIVLLVALAGVGALYAIAYII